MGLNVFFTNVANIISNNDTGCYNCVIMEELFLVKDRFVRINFIKISIERISSWV